MHVGVCTIELHLPGNTSLKEKRGVLKPVISRIRQEFNVSIAEVDRQDAWQQAVLGVACVSASADYAHGQLQRVVQWIESTRLDVELIDYQIDLL